MSGSRARGPREMVSGGEWIYGRNPVEEVLAAGRRTCSEIVLPPRTDGEDAQIARIRDEAAAVPIDLDGVQDIGHPAVVKPHVDDGSDDLRHDADMLLFHSILHEKGRKRFAFPNFMSLRGTGAGRGTISWPTEFTK